jgi:hypothetical protein
VVPIQPSGIGLTEKLQGGNYQQNATDLACGHGTSESKNWGILFFARNSLGVTICLQAEFRREKAPAERNTNNRRRSAFHLHGFDAESASQKRETLLFPFLHYVPHPFVLTGGTVVYKGFLKGKK